MAVDKKKKVVVRKKIKPYPIEGVMMKGTVKVVLAIIRISPKGLVAQIRSGICQVGIHYECQFSLPVSVYAVHAHVQVYKTYDGIESKTHKIQRLAEMLFVKLPDSDQNKIRGFLESIGQKE